VPKTIEANKSTHNTVMQERELLFAYNSQNDIHL